MKTLRLKYSILKTLLSFALALTISSCSDFIEVDDPITLLIRKDVFEDDLTAVAAVSGLYTSLAAQSGLNSITYLTSLSSDEMKVEQGVEPLQFYRNAILSTNASVASIWTESYSVIYKANSIIEGLEKSSKITIPLKNQLLGEAKFFRAFHHLYLVNLFGAVPYVIETDYTKNELISRVAIADVYEKITTDLLAAKALLSDDYSYSQGTRVRVNKWAATALLARVYLYREDWLHAEEQATTVIGKTVLYALTVLDSVFLKNSSETIWQLIPPNLQKYTSEGNLFNRPSYSAGVATMSEELFTAFEDNDNRKTKWVGIGNSGAQSWCYPLKYKETYNNGTGAEYSTVLRLAEQYLIRAEARAKQDKLTGANSAASDLNIVRIRAGLPNTTAISKIDLLAAIQQEKKVELFTEWGHRWLDLKRTGQVNNILSSIKSGWDDTDVLFPIPLTEIQLNPNLKPQNDGY